MTIGFDAKRAFNNHTGLGNYSRLVIEGIGQEYPADRLLLYTPKRGTNPRMDSILSLPNVTVNLPAGQGFKGALWRTFGITNNLKADGVDLYHGLSNELPLNIAEGGVPSVVTIHDVIYRRLPYCYKPLDRLIYDYKYGRSVRNATRVIAVSERTKSDIVELYGTDPDKISVVYQGCDESFKQRWSESKLAELRHRLGLPERYLLQVGTIERRKNLELTIRALGELPADLHLVAVGRDHYGYKKECQRIAAETGVADRIHFLEGLPFAELPGVNQAAEVICYPSRYEGFGIPVLEGLSSRRPVVAATGSCLEEAGGDGAIYVHPDDAAAMSQAIREIIRGGETCRRLLEAGAEHAAKFNIGDIARNVRTVYEQLL